MTDKSLSIRVELKGNYLDDFMKIQEEGNFLTNTDTIRYCIQTTATESNFHLTQNMIDKISEMLALKNVKSKYYIYSISDFVKEALKHFITVIEENQASIHDWDVRSKLSPEELKIAHGIIEVQNSSTFKEFTQSQLAKQLDYRNQSKLSEILLSFTELGYLKHRQEGKTKFYHAH